MAKLRAARMLVGRVADACGASSAGSVMHLPPPPRAHAGAARSLGEHAARHRGLRGRGLRRRRRRSPCCRSPGQWAGPTPSPDASPAIRTWCCRRRAGSAASSIRGGRLGVEKLTRGSGQGRPGSCSRTSRPGAAWRRVWRAGSSAGRDREGGRGAGEDIATGRLELTGVSAFPRLGDDGVKVAPHPPADRS